jgi:hypothetical protein
MGLKMVNANDPQALLAVSLVALSMISRQILDLFVASRLFVKLCLTSNFNLNNRSHN